MATNRRKRARRTLGYPANIIATDESCSHACYVVDISDTGARLLTREPLKNPGEFMLVLSDRHNVVRYCRVAWARACEIGVAFAAPPRVEKRPPPVEAAPLAPADDTVEAEQPPRVEEHADTAG